MKTSIAFSKHLGVLALLVAISMPGFASIIYNNSSNDIVTRFVYSGKEIGDEITLAGTDRVLIDFSFEFFGTNLLGNPGFSGTPEARVRFYQNDGAPFNGYATPGSIFYDSGFFSIGGPTTRSTAEFTLADFGPGGLYMPVVSNMTWSVDFANLGPSDQVGLDIYDPPVVGSSFSDYWENTPGWTLKTNAGVNVNFASVFIATVPEPSMVGLYILGGMMTVGGMIRARRK